MVIIAFVHPKMHLEYLESYGQIPLNLAEYHKNDKRFL